MLGLVAEICSALEEIHGAGFVHGNLKPQAIVVLPRPDGGERIKLRDLSRCRRPGISVLPVSLPQGYDGTPRYFSPEQATGQSLGRRSDIYTVGTIAYELLTGRAPFEATRALGFLHKHAHERPLMPSDRFRELRLAPAVEALLSRCLRKSPERRFRDAAALRRECNRIRKRLARTRPPGRSSRRTWTLVGALLAAAGAGLALGLSLG